MGFVKRSSNPTVLEITEWNHDLTQSHVRRSEFRHVATLGFTSQRARVTVIYMDEEGKTLVMSKGQDTVILPLLASLGSSKEDDLLQQLKDLFGHLAQLLATIPRFGFHS